MNACKESKEELRWTCTCVACVVYLCLSETERLRIQAGMFENFLSGFLRCNRVFDLLRAQNFVSAFKEHSNIKVV